MRAAPEFRRSETVMVFGRILVAVALVVFGIQHFLYAGFVAGLVPAWMPARLFWAYFVGVAFFAAAVGIVIQRTMRLAGALLGVMFLLFVTMLHIPRIVAHSRGGNEWTSGFVALAMCGGSLGSCQRLLLGRARNRGSAPQTRAIFLWVGDDDVRGSTLH